MANHIYNVEDFEERLSELTIGTEDVQQLMEFVRRREKQIKWMNVRLETAATIIGHQTITDCMMEEDDG